MIDRIKDYEDKGVSYFIKDPEVYRNKKVLIAGGGDSALDWSIFLADVASEVTLVHRRNEFRGALDSVEKVQSLKNLGKINLITPAEVVGLKGSVKLEAVVINKSGDQDEEIIKEAEETFLATADNFKLLFGEKGLNMIMEVEFKTIDGRDAEVKDGTHFDKDIYCLYTFFNADDEANQIRH